MPEQPLDDVLDEVHAFVRQEIAGGYSPIEEIPLTTAEYFQGTCDTKAAQAAAERYLPSALRAHFAEQATWPEVTDCDRLDLAFADLEAAGIVARQNFSCCTTCGQTEILDEMEAARVRGAAVRGYTFFHGQDVECAVQGGGVYLAYGTGDDDDDDGILRVGEEIRKALEGRSLPVEWDGTADRKIGVPLKWQRRREA